MAANLNKKVGSKVQIPTDATVSTPRLQHVISPEPSHWSVPKTDPSSLPTDLVRRSSLPIGRSPTWAWWLVGGGDWQGERVPCPRGDAHWSAPHVGEPREPPSPHWWTNRIPPRRGPAHLAPVGRRCAGSSSRSNPAWGGARRGLFLLARRIPRHLLARGEGGKEAKGGSRAFSSVNRQGTG
ncbi:hypothetical protein chiPu_0022319 [Chiloscyllium punctatum]|uniref:Uncharacterized protein n=1 Tax=Chiloscyllium punctatum TaxID=137246 RepID=A0A401RHY8_CHIPU|nr:hypothetical protein [Chiloscyllium punctatum]